MEQRQQETGLVPVASSNVRAIGWDDGALTVEYRSGARYRYAAPIEVYEALLAAPSKGKYLASHVKGTYPYARQGVQA